MKRRATTAKVPLNAKNILRLHFIMFKSIGITFLFLGMVPFVSCEKFVEVDTPTSQLTADNVFEDTATAEAAMTEIYAKLRDSGILTGSITGLSNILGCYSDELDFYGQNTSAILPFYQNTLLVSDPTVASWWSSTYNLIYAVNTLIESLSRSESLAKEDRDQLTGEALFVRAMLHFYLANLFGGIPYITTSDYRENKQVSRTQISDVYANSIKDLDHSVSILGNNYIVPDRTRPNKSTVMAILARVYLYDHQWQKAGNASSYVLDRTDLYTWENDLEKVFLKESRSTLWQFAPGYSGTNTQEGETFIFTSAPPKLVALTEEFMASFELGDLRKAHWTEPVSDGETTWYHPYKYKQQGITGTVMEYSVQLRLAEQFLIRAEARAQLGDLIGAKDDLDKIRIRAGIGASTATTKEEVVNEILQQRRTELFTETGHRFFDLKRMGHLDEVLSRVKLGWNTTDALMPLPENELLLNPRLSPQNTGY